MKKNFLWGTATAATQVEGAYNEDGKGMTIWDEYSVENVAHRQTCRVACDHYHRYKQDVAIMKEIGVNSYRFSISWARIYPDNTGKVNKKGLIFYNDLVNELIKNNIKPLITLFHWDLPVWIYENGGFLRGDFPDLFEKYTKTIVEAFSDRVEYWITFNEPQCFVGGGFAYGYLAPYLKSDSKTVNKITRNIMLAHGKAVKCIRKCAKLPAKIGYAPTSSIHIPIDDSEKAIKKAYNTTFNTNLGVGSAGWWSEPIVGGVVPKNMKFLSKKDMEIIAQPLDFYAFNIYKPDNDEDFYYPGINISTMGWPVIPKCMYWACKFFYKRYNLPILVSENGFANIDVVSPDGKIHDYARIDYIDKHLEQLEKAEKEGVPIIGFMYWSLMDNFEWSCAYDKRFGLVYIDYLTQNRIIKDSAYFYKQKIKEMTDK